MCKLRFADAKLFFAPAECAEYVLGGKWLIAVRRKLAAGSVIEFSLPPANGAS
jgi:hypothetical protein